jgi:hypothetical protein
MATNQKVISISRGRKSQQVHIAVTRGDIKGGIAHPWLSPVSSALCGALDIDGAEVKHDTIRLFREGKKDVVIQTPESVQRFSYLFDMHGSKGVGPFRFPISVPAGLVRVIEEVA